METKTKIPKRLQGIVASNKMQKTLVVRVSRLVQHPKYKKRFKISKRYKAHYEGGDYNVGDKVVIEETRPISKNKSWKVIS
jgi:small subunit ribosomal protein S17